MSVILDAPERERRPPNGTLPLVVVVLALLGGWMLFGGSFETATDNGAGSDGIAASDPIPLVDQVPGLTGTLHVILDNGSETTYTRWPTDRHGPDLIEVVESSTELNADATQLAWTDELGNLWVGPPGAPRLVAPEIDGFAWHDTAPDSIAFTRRILGTSQLHVGTTDTTTGFVAVTVSALPDTLVIDAFGDWGFATRIDRTGPDDLLVLNSFGELVRQYEGNTFGAVAGDEGGLVIVDQASGDVFVGATQPSETSAVPAEGVVRTIEFSSSLGKAAVAVDLGSAQVVQVVAAGGAVEAQAEVEAIGVSWGAEGRFVFIRTNDRGLTVLDSWDESLTTVRLAGRVLGVVVTPTA